MPDLLRNILAIVAGIVVGGGVNAALITLGPWLIPPPAGVDMNDVESIPAPTWFIALDLLAAYLPMAWLGIHLGTRLKQRR